MERAHREVVRRPRTDSGQCDRRRDEPLEVGTVEPELAGDDRARESVNRGRARTRHADLRDRVDAGGDHLAWRWKPVRERISGSVLLAKRRREPAGECRRSSDRDLLSEQRAHRCFETIDRAR
jgi:hypothetical protein